MSNDLIRQYSDFPQGFEGWEKVEIILELEEAFERAENRENQSEIFIFFLRIARNPNEYDLARIEIFKILNVLDIEKSDEISLTETIAAVLADETDEVIRQYATFPLAKYSHRKLAGKIAEELLLNAGEDESVRHIALSVFESNKQKNRLEKIYLKLNKEDKMRNYIYSVLSEM